MDRNNKFPRVQDPKGSLLSAEELERRRRDKASQEKIQAEQALKALEIELDKLVVHALQMVKAHRNLAASQVIFRFEMAKSLLKELIRDKKLNDADGRTDLN